MSEPLLVVIPHRLGKAEALARIKRRLFRAEAEFARLISFDHRPMGGRPVQLAASALGQRALAFRCL